MIYPPVFETLSNDSDISTLLSSGGILKIFDFAKAQQLKPAAPYVVWQITGGAPENYLATTPDVDAWTLQFDIYGNGMAEVSDMAEAIRNALDGIAYITFWGGSTTEPNTKLSRFTFTVDWWQYR